MLRNIPPILSPDLLHALRAMGHGNEIVIADANFPAEALGPKCIRADGCAADEMLAAVLKVMPLDDFVPDPALTMQPVEEPDNLPPVVKVFQGIIDKTADTPAPIRTLERFAFYDRTSQAYAIIQTGERRLYGNIILKKGIIR